jgi:hypothetical protein
VVFDEGDVVIDVRDLLRSLLDADGVVMIGGGRSAFAAGLLALSKRAAACWP